MKHRRTRRTCIAIAVFVVAGVVLNVLVAWGCALWSPLTWKSGPPTPSTTAAWVWPITPSEWTFRSSHTASGFGITGTQTDDIEAPMRIERSADAPQFQTFGASSRAEYAAGWPLRCLRWEWAEQHRTESVSDYVPGYSPYSDARTDTRTSGTGIDIRGWLHTLRPRLASYPARSSAPPQWPRLAIEPG